jgi:hypothetical protein
MNLVKLDHALRQLRLGGIATALESRQLQAQTEHMAPIDLLSMLSPTSFAGVLIACPSGAPRRPTFARRTGRSTFDFDKKMNRRIIYELAAGHIVTQHADALFLRQPGTGKPGKCHLAQAIGRGAINRVTVSVPRS